MLMPTTRPSMSTRGPPELPGLIAASVWMKSSIAYGFSVRLMMPRLPRPIALTIPAVMVNSRPKGLPSASTHSPTRTRSSVASCAVGKPFCSIFRTAMSVDGSPPTTVASNCRRSLRITRISSSPSITWWLVRM